MPLTRRRTIALLAAAGAGRALAQNAEGPVLRAALERAYAPWLQAMRASDPAALAAATSRYRQMSLRNEIISLRQPWPAAVFKILRAPDISRLTFLEATALGDTARAVYFGRVDFALDTPSPPENALILRFLKESGAWKLDWIQYVNFGADEATRREVKAGARQFLESEEFQLTGRYPAVPKPCREPYMIAALKILATSCKVTVDVNQGAHTETVDNKAGGLIITGGLQKGYNNLRITPVAQAGAAIPPQLEIAILTRREANTPAVKLWSWKPPEPSAQWKPQYDTSLFVKSRSTV